MVDTARDCQEFRVWAAILASVEHQRPAPNFTKRPAQRCHDPQLGCTPGYWRCPDDRMDIPSPNEHVIIRFITWSSLPKFDAQREIGRP